MAEINVLHQLSDSELCDEFVRRHASDPDDARPYLREFVARQQAKAPVGDNGTFFKTLARLARAEAAIHE